MSNIIPCWAESRENLTQEALCGVSQKDSLQTLWCRPQSNGYADTAALVQALDGGCGTVRMCPRADAEEGLNLVGLVGIELLGTGEIDCNIAEFWLQFGTHSDETAKAVENFIPELAHRGQLNCPRLAGRPSPPNVSFRIADRPAHWNQSRPSEHPALHVSLTFLSVARKPCGIGVRPWAGSVLKRTPGISSTPASDLQCYL